MYLINYFWRTQSIFLFSLPFLLLSFLAGCQGGVNNGVSSHVSTGVKNAPLAQSKPISQPAKPASQPKPQQAAAPTPPVNKSQPAPTNVQVLTANPQQGIPLGDDTQIEMDSIQPQPEKPQPAPTPVPKPAPEPIAAPVPSPAPIIPSPAPVSVAVQEAVEEPVIAQAPEQNWLERYPNLSEDLKNYQQTITQLEKEAKAYQNKINELQEKVKKQWGGVAPQPTTAHQFVKYTDSYQSRGEMDFDNGKIVVETIDPSNPKQHLREAIITTLLTPYDAENPEIYTDKKINYVGPALLAGQVLDHEGEPVKWEWRAERFADYLVDNKVQEIQRNGQVVYRVEIPLVENHTQVRGHQYEHLVRTAAERYSIDEVLIYAIIETESHFNPYATSHIPAYGLMQVVPSTAGKDVFTRIKKRNDQPTRDYLFNTTNNIDTGTAYLSILRDNYLNKITHPLSREYAMISGYNGGAGNVLRTFHKDRAQAVNVINQLTPQQVYNQLHLKHPRAEARGYIKKVTEAQQRYRTQAATASR